MFEATQRLILEVERLLVRGEEWVLPYPQERIAQNRLPGIQIELSGFITSKQDESLADCADNYAFNQDLLKFAISDGVSKSFFPKLWSRTLVEEFVKTKGIDFSIEKSQEDWRAQVLQIVQKPETKYYVRNAFKKNNPGLATFVGLEIDSTNRKWSAVALGDSFLFFIPDDDSSNFSFLSSMPTPPVFDNYPDYLSSVGNAHKGDQIQLKQQPLVAGRFVLVTDALAEWMFRDVEKALDTIEGWKTQKDFEDFAADARRDELLQNDDTAILLIKVQLERGAQAFQIKTFSSPYDNTVV